MTVSSGSGSPGEVGASAIELIVERRASAGKGKDRALAFGPDLGMPHKRTRGKGLFELRLNAKEGIGRALPPVAPAVPPDPVN
jgi:hypothetical protein